MNHNCLLYLATYGRVDTIDSMLIKLYLNYVTWKYWHAGKRDANALSIVVFYSFYKEVATEMMALQAFGIGSENEVFDVLDFHGFCARCALQELNYNPRNLRYLRDQVFVLSQSLHSRKEKLW